MLRGSKPGERRGGRKRATPNKRTVLTDRILSIGLEHPDLFAQGFLLKLVKDPKLPADIRMALAPKSFPLKRVREPRTGRSGARGGDIAPAPVSVPREWTPLTLDALFGVVQDAAADAETRRKAALKIAEFLLPKVAKKAKTLPDEYGFRVNPELAGEYRDIQLELRSLSNGPTRKIPAIAAKIKKLEARSDAIRQRLQVPCPTKYRIDEAVKDYVKLAEFAQLRYDETALTETQKAEEAHRRVRFDVFAYCPEQVGRRRLSVLQDQERRSQRSRVFGDFVASSLSAKDQKEFERLRWFYSKSSRSIFQRGEADRRETREELELSYYHPFKGEWPSWNGNLYPPQSKVRPVGVVTITWSGITPPFSPDVFYMLTSVRPDQSAEPPEAAIN
ncbi:MAG: hypothetical protein WA652_17575 [Xanthobacteraceae bacterium]